MKQKLFYSILLGLVLMPALSFAALTPRQIADSWAKATGARNGKIQYALMCPEQQKENLKTMQELNWVTGFSSPQVKSAEIKSVTQQGDHYMAEINYTMGLSGEKPFVISNMIEIKASPVGAGNTSKWCISKFKSLSPS